MKNPHSLDALAVASARQAQNQAAMLQRAVRALGDSVSGLTRGIAAPKIGIKRSTTKRTTSGANTAGWLGFGFAQLLDSGWLGDLDEKISGSVKIGGGRFSYSASQTGGGAYDPNDNSGSFYASDAQTASAQASLLSASQRIR